MKHDEEQRAEKLKDLLTQLTDGDIEVVDAGDNDGATLAEIKHGTRLTREALEHKLNDPHASFTAWVAWSKSF